MEVFRAARPLDRAVICGTREVFVRFFFFFIRHHIFLRAACQNCTAGKRLLPVTVGSVGFSKL